MLEQPQFSVQLLVFKVHRTEGIENGTNILKQIFPYVQKHDIGTEAKPKETQDLSLKIEVGLQKPQIENT